MTTKRERKGRDSTSRKKSSAAEGLFGQPEAKTLDVRDAYWKEIQIAEGQNGWDINCSQFQRRRAKKVRSPPHDT